MFYVLKTRSENKFLTYGIQEEIRMTSSKTTSVTHPVLRAKWAQAFYSIDIDDDGKWSKKDTKIIQQRLLADSRMPKAKRDDVEKLSEEVFQHFSKNEYLTEDQFIAELQKNLDNKTLESFIRDLRRRIFCCIDLNDDGKISFEEFKIVHEVIGKEVAEIDRAFRCIDTNSDGIIDMQEYQDAYVRYFCDPSIKLEDYPLYGLKIEKK